MQIRLENKLPHHAKCHQNKSPDEKIYHLMYDRMSCTKTKHPSYTKFLHTSTEVHTNDMQSYFYSISTTE
jgi:hypothetical protein